MILLNSGRRRERGGWFLSLSDDHQMDSYLAPCVLAVGAGIRLQSVVDRSVGNQAMSQSL